MANYTLRVIQNGQEPKTATLRDNQNARLAAESNTDYQLYNEQGELITHPVTERSGDDLWVFADGKKDGAPELVLTDYFNKSPILNADYVADAGNSLMTNDKLAAVVPVAESMWVKAATIGVAATIGGAIWALNDDDNGKPDWRVDNNPPPKTTPLNEPTITVHSINPITSKEGTTQLSGSLNLNNDNLDTEEVKVVILGQEFPARIAADKKSWTAEVPNVILVEANGVVKAKVDIGRGTGANQQTADAESTEKPAVLDANSPVHNVHSVPVDVKEPIPSKPIVTVDDLPDIKKSAMQDEYTLSGSLKNVDAGSTAKVFVSLNSGTAQEAKVEGDKWTLIIKGSDLKPENNVGATVIVSNATASSISEPAGTQFKVIDDVVVPTPQPTEELKEPTITIHTIDPITKLDGETEISGSLNLNNTGLDSEKITVIIDGKDYHAEPAADKKSWTAKVPNMDLVKAKGGIVAKVEITKDGQTASALNTEQPIVTDKDNPANNVNSFTVDLPVPPTSDLNPPYITVTPFAPITQANKDGKTTLTGKLDLNNENLKSETVKVVINGGEPITVPAENISADKTSWKLEVNNSVLIGDANAGHKILAIVEITSQEDKTAMNDSRFNDRDTDPAVNTDSFVVDVDITEPKITIEDVPNIEQGKELAEYTLQGKLEGIDADVEQKDVVVTVSINGTPVAQKVDVSADKTMWSVKVSGSDLAKTVGDNQKVTATVSVTDKVGNTATAAEAAEDMYNVIAASQPPVEPDLTPPTITVDDIAPITQANKDGKTTLTGKLALNNTELDSETVTVSINGGAEIVVPAENIGADKTSWKLEVGNDVLKGEANAPHTVVAKVSIAKGNKTASATNDADGKPFVVDVDITEPKITIEDVPNMEQGKELAEYTLQGKLEGIDVDVEQKDVVVTVSINGTPVAQKVDVSADKTMWSVKVSGSDLAKTVGDNQKVTATVSVTDKVGNTATAKEAAEDMYNVIASQPPVEPDLTPPTITVDDIAPITQANKDGKTTLTGKLALNNTELDSETVTVSINGGAEIIVPAENIGADKTSWKLEVGNDVLRGEANAPHTVVAKVSIAKGNKTASATNGADGKPFVVDVDITEPKITIEDVPNMEQGRELAEYTLQGKLEGIDADVEQKDVVVTVSINGAPVAQKVDVSADKTMWSVKVSGSDLAKDVGDNQKVTATVSVTDKVGNTATAAEAAEDMYNVAVPTPVVPEITINKITPDDLAVFNKLMVGQNKEITGQLVNVPVGSTPTVEVTVAGKPYTVNVSGSTWSIAVPVNELTERGAKEVVATLSVNGVTDTDNATFYVIDPLFTFDHQTIHITQDNLEGTTTLTGTYNVDGADESEIVVQIGTSTNVANNGVETVIKEFSSNDAINPVLLNSDTHTWSITISNRDLATEINNQGKLAVGAIMTYFENGVMQAPVSTSSAYSYQSDVVAPPASPYLVDDLVEAPMPSTNHALTVTVDMDDKDSVSGSSVADTFVFSKVLDGSIATITNFDVSEDRVQLSSEVFTALSNTMSDFADYVQYDAATGALSYDADGVGSGAAVQFAQLDKGLDIEQNHFIIA